MIDDTKTSGDSGTEDKPDSQGQNEDATKGDDQK